MHHYNTPKTRMHSPDQCSTSYLFTPPPPPPPPPPTTNLLPVRIMGYCNKRCPWGIINTQNVLTPGPHICMTMGLHACQCIVLPCIYNGIQSDFDQHNRTHAQHCMNGEADNSRMYVYMHLVFKELNMLYDTNVGYTLLFWE